MPETNRQFSFAVNQSGRDKDWNWEVLATQYQDKTGTLDDVIAHVKAGHALCAGLLNGQRRKKENVIGSEWLLLDIDNSTVLKNERGETVKDEEGKSIKIYQHDLTLEEAIAHPFVQQHCALIYTTASHKPEWNKFRLVFLLPEFVEGTLAVEAMVRFLMEKFPHDPSCKDASRVFYGSTRAEFPLINPNAYLPSDWLEKAVEAADEEKVEILARAEAARARREKALEISEKEGWNDDELIRQALSVIPPRDFGSGNYEECMKVLMALVSHYGQAEAISIAEGWSPSIRGTKWNIPQKVRSMTGSGVSIGTLFHIAKNHGFKFPSSTSTKKKSMKSAAKNSPAGKAVKVSIQSLIIPPNPLEFVGCNEEIITNSISWKIGTKTVEAQRFDYGNGKFAAQFLNAEGAKEVQYGIEGFGKTTTPKTLNLPVYRLESALLRQSVLGGNTVFCCDSEEEADLFVASFGLAAVALPKKEEKGALQKAALELNYQGVSLVYVGMSMPARMIKTLAESGVYSFECRLDSGLKELLSGRKPEEAKAEILGRVNEIHKLKLEAAEKEKQEIEALIERDRLEGGGSKTNQNFSCAMAMQISQKYQEKLKYEAAKKIWWQYEVKAPGMWGEINIEDLKAMVIEEVAKSAPDEIKQKRIEEIIYFLKTLCRLDRMQAKKDFIPFTNGVLDKKSGNFQGHSPKNLLTTCLPYAYENVGKKTRRQLIHECRPIIDWMYECMGGTNDSWELVKLMLAWQAAVVRGRTDLHKYMECIGVTRSGKGTFLRLTTALVGQKNAVSTSLEKIEKDRFTIASIIDAALILVTEADRHSGSCSVMKAITGGDTLNGEKKGIQINAADGRPAAGLVMVAGEFNPVMIDMGGIEKRRITLPFLHSVSDRNQRDLISFDADGNASGEFAPYLPALFNLVFSYTDKEIYDYVKCTEETVKVFGKIKSDAVLSSNMLAVFLEECCYWDEKDALPKEGAAYQTKVKVGTAKKSDHGEYEQAGHWLYPCYKQWADGAGVHPMSLVRFSSAICDTMEGILKMKVTFRREEKGAHIYGLGIRGDHPTAPRIVSQLFAGNLPKEQAVEIDYGEFLPLTPEEVAELDEIREISSQGVEPEAELEAQKEKESLSSILTRFSPVALVQAIQEAHPDLTKELAKELKARLLT